MNLITKNNKEYNFKNKAITVAFIALFTLFLSDSPRANDEDDSTSPTLEEVQEATPVETTPATESSDSESTEWEE